MEDDKLVSQCLNGHSHAFEVLVGRYQKPLFNTALRMLKNTQDAEDVTQTAFLKAYESLPSFNPSYQFFSWIYRITVNETLNFVKTRRRVSQVDSPADYEEAVAEDEEEAYESSDRVDMALGHLTPEERAILLLKHVEGFSYDEIGYIFDISLKLVKSRLYMARQHLKDVLVKQSVGPAS